MSQELKPIKLISPSSFYYWEKCPLRAVFAENYRGIRTFPTHPDSALGNVIHSFYENKANWGINDSDSFEKKWAAEIKKINNKYLVDSLQRVFFPIEWHSKFYAVKKIQLRENILKHQKSFDSSFSKVKFEKWFDDGVDIGGVIDLVKYNKSNEIIEIVDFKTGSIFEIKKKKRIIKTSYKSQLALYAYLISINQSFIPRCFVQNNCGKKYEIKVGEKEIQFIQRKAIELKNKINNSILNNRPDELAYATFENCVYCNYRPLCKIYKRTLINDFSNKMVDVFGKVEKIIDPGVIVLSIPGKVLTLKNINSIEEIREGELVFVYNLFCPDQNDHILFASKSTIITNE